MNTKSDATKVILGLLISIGSIFIPLLLSSFSHEQLIGNTNLFSILMILVDVSILISIGLCIYDIVLIKKDKKHFGLGMLIPAAVFLVFIVYLTHGFGIIDMLFLN